MSSLNQNVIRHKIGLLNLATELGNVSRACKLMGLSNNGVATDLALPSGVARFNAASSGANQLIIVLTGDAAAGQCVVNASVDVSASPMQWVFQTAASTPECYRDQTGVGARTG